MKNESFCASRIFHNPLHKSVDRIKTNGTERSSGDSITEFSFPCVIDIKVFLLAGENNPMLVRKLILQYIAETDLLEISVKESRKAKYQSLNCRVNAQSKMLMDLVYKALSAHPDILMVL